MKQAIPLLKGIMTFCIAAFACILLLLAVVAAIPQRAIAENCRDAADYFSAHDGFPLLIEGVEGSRIDNYADTALLDVIFCADSAQPLRSVIVAPYYRNDGQDIRADFQAAVDGAASNNEYARYWHGSQVFLRPLLLVTSIEGCRAALFILFLAINVALAVVLARKKAWLPFVGYFAALVCVQFYTAAFTLEYIMVLLVMSAASLAVAALKDSRHLTTVFILSGVLTCFLDFLTAETLSFTIPVLLALMLMEKERRTLLAHLLQLVKWGAAWLCSYAAMFAIKWLAVWAMAGEEVFRNIFTFAALRIDGQTLLSDGTVGTVTPLTAVARNVAALLPFVNEAASVTAVILTAVAVLLVIFAVLYLFRGDGLDMGYLLCLLLVGLLPYVRYCLIYSHAHVHYFFTFRAQMALLLAVFAICVHCLRSSPLWSKKAPRKKGGRR